MEVDKLPKKESPVAPVKHENKEDFIEKTIGAFGVWQAKVCILASLTRFLAIWNMLNIMFLTHDKDFICVKFNGSQLVNVTPSTCYVDCVKYKFDEELFDKGFVSEFKLICENAWMASFAQTILMFGMMCGVVLFGWISDRFGRSKAILSSAILLVIFMLGSCFATGYWTFCALRFLTGVAAAGQMVAAIVIVLEVVGTRHREVAGALCTLPDGIAEASLVVFVYFSPTWRKYLLSMSTMSALIMVIVMFMPESPRWLMSTGQTHKAEKMMMKAAVCNNLNAVAIEETIRNNAILTGLTEKTTATFCDLFKSRKLTVRIFASIFIWIANGLCFFGINQYCITFLETGVFLSVITLGLIQIPSCFIAPWLNKDFGRKAAIISNLMITGLTMLLLMFSPKDHWSALTLATIGLLAVNNTFKVLSIFTPELFPTPLRNMAYGVISMGAKIGAMVAPFIANLSPLWLPSLILSIMALMGAAVCCVLPETKEKVLEDDLEHID